LNALQYLILLILISLQEVGAMMITPRTSGNRAFSAIGKSCFWKSSCLHTASRSTSNNRTYNGLLPKYPNRLFYNTEQHVNDTSCHATTTTTSIQTMSNAMSYTTTGCDISTKSSLISHEESFPKATNNIPPTKHDEYETVFSLDVPEGKCVALRLSNPYQAKSLPTSLDPYQIQSNPNHWLRQILHPEEIEYGCQLSSEPARISFFMGRLAMRTALAQAHGNDTTNDSWEYEDGIGGFAQLPIVTSLDQSILKDEHGRPQVPQGFIGSISHKATTGVALIAPIPASYNDKECQMTPKIGIGVDIEQAFSRRRNIAKKILTPNELNDLGNLNGVTRDEEVLLRFSLKESVYKAMHPLICQFVGFQEAEIKPHSDGTATINLFLKSGAHEMFKETKAHWRRIEGDLFLTSASITLH
jgi:phosphopantetheine--protein transferase-like protein